MKARRLEYGNVKVAYYPKPYRGEAWIATDQQAGALYALRDDGWEIEEVASCGAQSEHVIVNFESMGDFLRDRYHVEGLLLNTINGREAETNA